MEQGAGRISCQTYQGSNDERHLFKLSLLSLPNLPPSPFALLLPRWAINAWNQKEDFSIAVGAGGAPKTKRICPFPVLLLFPKASEPDGGAYAPLEGVTQDTSPSQKPLGLTPEDPEFFMHLHLPLLLPTL